MSAYKIFAIRVQFTLTTYLRDEFGPVSTSKTPEQEADFIVVSKSEKLAVASALEAYIGADARILAVTEQKVDLILIEATP
jgi:hypothetical protein